MKEIFRQYGGIMIAACATGAFLVLMGSIFLSQGGMLSRMIEVWGNNAI